MLMEDRSIVTKQSLPRQRAGPHATEAACGPERALVERAGSARSRGGERTTVWITAGFANTKASTPRETPHGVLQDRCTVRDACTYTVRTRGRAAFAHARRRLQ